MTNTNNQIAGALIDAHKTGRQIAPPARALTRSDILEVQSIVATALGPVAGFKVGRTADGPPILAPLPACYTVADGGTRPVKNRLGVELEIGFEVIRALPGVTVPSKPQDYLRPVVVFELVDSRFDRSDLSNDEKFCDLQLNAGLVVGTGLTEWDGSDFGSVRAQLTANTDTFLDDDRSVPGGSALENLGLLLEHLGAHCGGVQVGHILITGSLIGLPYFPADCSLVGKIDGIGQVSVKLAAANASPN